MPNYQLQISNLKLLQLQITCKLQILFRNHKGQIHSQV